MIEVHRAAAKGCEAANQNEGRVEARLLVGGGRLRRMGAAVVNVKPCVIPDAAMPSMTGSASFGKSSGDGKLKPSDFQTNFHRGWFKTGDSDSTGACV